MSPEDNRSAANLLLLCEEHAFEVDATPQHFPAALLHEWKTAQLTEHADLGRSWPLSDAEAAEVAAQSFDHRKIAMFNATATSVLSLARLVGLLAETGRIERRGPQGAVFAWLRTRDEVNRSTLVFDANGERLYVEPSRSETQQHIAALQVSLGTAVRALEPIATQVIAELHAVCAADEDLVPWCRWVEIAVRNVITAAGRWPGRPPQDDDDVWPRSLEELSRAMSALTSRWRGEDAPEPPNSEPGSAPVPTETDVERRSRVHRELLDSARPWARVTHRRYDPQLCQRLIEATASVSAFPDILSLAPFGLDATARLASKVARNADDAAFGELIEQAAMRQPFAAAATLLRELMFVAEEAGRSELQARARAAAAALLEGETWQGSTVWHDNRPHARKLLGWTASATSDEAVRATLTRALGEDPAVLPAAILGMAQWVEQRDIQDFEELLGLGFRIRDIPAWFPTETFVVAIQRDFPHIVPSDEDESERYADDFERLASQVLWLASR